MGPVQGTSQGITVMVGGAGDGVNKLFGSHLMSAAAATAAGPWTPAPGFARLRFLAHVRVSGPPCRLASPHAMRSKMCR